MFGSVSCLDDQVLNDLAVRNTTGVWSRLFSDREFNGTQLSFQRNQNSRDRKRISKFSTSSFTEKTWI
ncbi:hypothetical protein TorRG33x02_358070 [Trema orientale]|uniref:Uncharacterized protein n=1 Tax=Trema orientale TaxID=63057 RepID=A0A2P5A471_TREOI|nr:hypothetical protein TorRG33x02_358070 [Trema orientale]